MGSSAAAASGWPGGEQLLHWPAHLLQGGLINLPASANIYQLAHEEV
jgi:hypothetical protein